MNDNRYLWLFGFLINYALLLVLSGSLLFTYEINFIFWVAVILWSAFTLLYQFRKYTAPLAKAVMILYVMVFFDHYLGYNFNSTFAASMEQYFAWSGSGSIIAFVRQTVSYYSLETTSVAREFPTQIFILVSSAITFSTTLLVNRRNIRALLIIPPLFFMVQWMRYVDISFTAIRWYMIGFVGYLVQLQFKRHASSNGNFSQRDYFLYATAIGTLIMVMTSALFMVYPLEKINAEMSSFMPTLSSMRTGYTARSDEYIFSFESTMYQPNENILGGSILERNYDEVMLVDSPYGGQYLRGRVKDNYTGFAWEASHTKYKNRTIFEGKEIDAYAMTVYPTQIQTATIFAPIGVRSIDLDVNKVFMNQDEIYYYNRDSFEGRLEAYDLIMYKRPINLKKINDLSPYLQLPDNISERLKSLTMLITAEEEEDSSKIQTLVDYLTANYDYSLLVNNISYETEFVDYFIFDEKRGYCTYFATAIAVMSRISGIPSRYVEGYITDVEKNDEGYYVVTGDRAHAWVEVYIDGVWTLIEATPYYIDEGEATQIEFDLDTVVEKDIGERPEFEKDDLEPMMPSITDQTRSRWKWPWFGAGIVLIALLTRFVARVFRQLTIEERLILIIETISTDETFIHHSYIPEELINAYSMKNYGYRIGDESRALLQRVIYSSLSLNAMENSIIIEEIEYLEKRTRKHFGWWKMLRIRYKLFKKR
jgi:transglutaminase-like putative cysteine protease